MRKSAVGTEMLRDSTEKWSRDRVAERKYGKEQFERSVRWTGVTGSGGEVGIFRGVGKEKVERVE
eukprot:470461-Pleurochrysis_carterae.AAC.1